MLKFQALGFIKICSCFNMQAWATCIKVCFNSNILVFVDEMLWLFIKYVSVSWNTLMARIKSELGFPFGIGFKPWGTRLGHVWNFEGVIEESRCSNIDTPLMRIFFFFFLGWFYNVIVLAVWSNNCWFSKFAHPLVCCWKKLEVEWCNIWNLIICMTSHKWEILFNLSKLWFLFFSGKKWKLEKLYIILPQRSFSQLLRGGWKRCHYKLQRLA